MIEEWLTQSYQKIIEQVGKEIIGQDENVYNEESYDIDFSSVDIIFVILAKIIIKFKIVPGLRV